MPFRELIRLLRPKQWIKNFFVFAPLIFSLSLFEGPRELEALRAFVSFCLMASAVYIINDIRDAEADRAHPEKKTRPIAAGTISIGRALVVLAVLIIITSLIVIGMDNRFIAVLLAYLLMNAAYSFKLKEVVLLDVFTISAGFMMRVLGGAYAINVQVSSWIVLCTLFIALFLGFAKRRGEIVLSDTRGTVPERKVLGAYQVGFVDQMLTIVSAGTVISYALYTVANRTLEVLGTDKMIYTTVFVLYGMFRYLYLIHTGSSTENPTNAVTSDPTIVVTGVLWILSCILLIYFGGSVEAILR
jgi:4-hydroxybenzoate polyprenyltransferase